MRLEGLPVMSHRLFNLEEAAEYLHLTPEEVTRRVKDREIPFEMRGDRAVFRKQDIDQWASQRILGLSKNRLVEYHLKSSQSARELQECLMPSMLDRGVIDSAMTAKTKASVMRELVELADKSWQVSDTRGLLASLEAREELGSTAVPGGLALPHPRFHDQYLFESSFLVIGRSLQEIHFGAPDGQPTDLFFLICCQDDRLHLLTLARLCLMAQKTELLAALRAAPDAEGMRAALVESEQRVLNDSTRV